MIEALQLLHALEQDSTRYSGAYYVRHLYKNEPIPQFGHGILESPLAQRDWIWLAYSSRDDSPLAILVASPAHNIAMLLRIYASPSSFTSVLLGLFRKALADMLSRGYTQYAVFLDLEQTSCNSLLKLAKHAGATQIEGKHIFITGPTDVRR